MTATLTIRDETPGGEPLHDWVLEVTTERMTVRELIRSRVSRNANEEVVDGKSEHPLSFFEATMIFAICLASWKVCMSVPFAHGDQGSALALPIQFAERGGPQPAVFGAFTEPSRRARAAGCV